jgi:hypothetical protein
MMEKSGPGAAGRGLSGVADPVAARRPAISQKLGSDNVPNRCDAPTHGFADAQGGRYR